MDIDITSLMARKDEMSNYSASIFETGIDDIGNVTWQNALDVFSAESYGHGEPIPWLAESVDDIETARDWFADSGGWTREDIDQWDKQEVNALLLQFIAGDIREREVYAQQDELERYEENIGGKISQSGNQWFYYVGC